MSNQEAPLPEAETPAGEPRLTEAVRAAFAPHAHPKATALTRCIDHMGAFAKIDSSRMLSKMLQAARGNAGVELVIDRRTLLLGILATGQDPRNDGRGLNSATWLRQWLQSAEGPISLPPGDLAGVERAFAGGAGIVFSESVRGRIFARAHSLAKATVQRPQFDLRHLLFALAEEDDSLWGEVMPGGLGPTRASRLRSFLVERITRDPEPGEDVGV